MKKDLFASCCSPGYLLIGLVFAVSFFVQNEFKEIIYVIFFLLLGSACTWNYKRCGRFHCKYTGIGFLIVGVIALLKVLQIISISWDFIWGTFLTTTAVCFLLEYKFKSKTGSCYKK